MTSAPEFDRLTGLLAFSRFKEEVFHKIIGGYAEGFQIFYCDFENFKYFNEKYSYATGDQLLKEFSDFLIEAARHWGECFLCRVMGDQFVLYLSCRDEKGPLHYADTLCAGCSSIRPSITRRYACGCGWVCMPLSPAA